MIRNKIPSEQYGYPQFCEFHTLKIFSKKAVLYNTCQQKVSMDQIKKIYSALTRDVLLETGEGNFHKYKEFAHARKESKT